MSKFTPTNPTSPSTPAAGTTQSSMALPKWFIDKYKLKQGASSLSYASSSGNISPQTGKELYDSIWKNTTLTKAQKTDLSNHWFPPNIAKLKTSQRDAYFNSITYDPNFLSGNLSALAAPTPAAVAGASQAILYKSAFTNLKGTASNLAVELKNATSGQEQSAYGVVSSYLEEWGLTQDAPYVYQMIMHQGAHLINHEEILNAVRGNAPSGLGPQVDRILRQNYVSAFPGLAEYNQQKNAVHMSETQYMSYTQSIMNQATQYGAPMPQKNQIGQLLNGHVSAVEYGQRLTDIYAAVSNADAGTKAILQEQYGITQQNLMHYFMDPKNALQTMQRQVASAEIQDYAQRVGLTGLKQTDYTQLADMAKLSATQGNQNLGYGVSGIQNALLTSSRDVALTGSLPGSNAPSIDTKTIIGSQLAGFAGTNQVAAQTAVQRAEQAKAAPFEKGGGYEENAKGVIGLGSART